MLLTPLCLVSAQPELYISKRLPLPVPAHSWHPKFDNKFDAIGQLPPVLSLPEQGAEAVAKIDQ